LASAGNFIRVYFCVGGDGDGDEAGIQVRAPARLTTSLKSSTSRGYTDKEDVDDENVYWQDVSSRFYRGILGVLGVATRAAHVENEDPNTNQS
jgi:hypothetical protein